MTSASGPTRPAQGNHPPIRKGSLITTLIYPPEWWITIPEICTALKITPQEITDWATNGIAPIPEIGADGIERIHRTDYETWLDQLTEDNHETDGDR